jgi:hypothetical protein
MKRNLAGTVSIWGTLSAHIALARLLHPHHLSSRQCNAGKCSLGGKCGHCTATSILCGWGGFPSLVRSAAWQPQHSDSRLAGLGKPGTKHAPCLRWRGPVGCRAARSQRPCCGPRDRWCWCCLHLAGTVLQPLGRRPRAPPGSQTCPLTGRSPGGTSRWQRVELRDAQSVGWQGNIWRRTG